MNIVNFYTTNKEVFSILLKSEFTFRYYDELLDKIQKLYDENKEQLLINIKLSKYNFLDLFETVSFIQERYPGVIIHLGYDKNVDSNFVPEIKDFKDLLKKTIEVFGDILMVSNIPMCYIPFPHKIKYIEVGKNIKKEDCHFCFYNNKCNGLYHMKDEPKKIIKQDITISVRSKYYDNFKKIFFDSFLKHYPEYLEHLHVFIDTNYPQHNSDNYLDYEVLAKQYGFTTHMTKREDEDYFILPNHYTHMLWKSVDGHKGKVISFDDDVEFYKSGLFDILSPLLDDNKIISQRFLGTRSKKNVPDNHNTIEFCIASWIYGINNDKIKYNKESFKNDNDDYCDGNDMIGFTISFRDDIYYFDEEIENLYFSAKCITGYFRHLSSKTYIEERDVLKYDFEILDRERRKTLR